MTPPAFRPHRAFLCAAFVYLIAQDANLAAAACPSGPSFLSPVSYSTGNNPRNVAIADFDEDGILDIAVASSSLYLGGPGSIAILRGNGTGGVGDGSFAAAVQYPAGYRPFSVAAGDFDADGILDLAVASFGQSGSCVGGSINILRGRGAAGVGDGTFAPPVSYAFGGKPYDVSIADFNEDGILDLAVADNTTGVGWTLRGQGIGGVGDGRFGGAIGYGLPDLTYAVGVADFDLDGIADILITGPNGVAVFRGHGTGGAGDGTFLDPVISGGGPDRYEHAIGDFDADGLPDVLVANGSFAGLRFLKGLGNGSFAPPANVLTGSNVSSVAAADFDLDGIADLAVMVSDQNKIVLMRGNGSSGLGNGTFSAASEIALPDFPQNAVSADLNEDGIPDLVVPQVTHPGSGMVGSVSVLIGTCNGPTPVLFTVESVDVTIERVRITWYSATQTSGRARIERRTAAQAWAALGMAEVDGTGYLVWEDREIQGGERYAYRVVMASGAETAETWVSVPGFAIALFGSTPNPGNQGLLAVSFSLPSREAATLTLFDVAGRLIETQSVGRLGAGRHSVTFGGPRRLAPGLYVIRLAVSDRNLTKRVVVR